MEQSVTATIYATINMRAETYLNKKMEKETHCEGCEYFATQFNSMVLKEPFCAIYLGGYKDIMNCRYYTKKRKQ